GPARTVRKRSVNEHDVLHGCLLGLRVSGAGKCRGNTSGEHSLGNLCHRVLLTELILNSVVRILVSADVPCRASTISDVKRRLSRRQFHLSAICRSGRAVAIASSIEWLIETKTLCAMWCAQYDNAGEVSRRRLSCGAERIVGVTSQCWGFMQ